MGATNPATLPPDGCAALALANSADNHLYTKVYTPEEKKAMGKAMRFLADMDQSFNEQVRPRFGKRGSNDEALRFLANMDQSYNGQVRPRFGKRASNPAQYAPEVDWVPDTEQGHPYKFVNRQI